MLPQAPGAGHRPAENQPAPAPVDPPAENVAAAGVPAAPDVPGDPAEELEADDEVEAAAEDAADGNNGAQGTLSRGLWLQIPQLEE